MRFRPANGSGTLLTINSHEAWVFQLGSLGYKLDIVDGMPGRYCRSWDEHVRPVPANARLVSLPSVLEGRGRYDCIIAHSVSDLMALKALPGPRILVIHGTLEGRARNEGLEGPPQGYVTLVQQYLDAVAGHAVAVSALKARSWGDFARDIIPFGVDVDAYPRHSGSIAAGIRVANQIHARQDILLWDLHLAAFADVPIRLVGHNPDMPEVRPSESFDELKALLSEHRFFVHTAHSALEDGYNMATIDAMACGLPVLGNRHPSSPVEQGVSGFLSDDPRELAECAKRLLADPELARRMGQAARETVREHFSIARFKRDFEHAIDRARSKFKRGGERAHRRAQPS